jgi:hypothetical protein
MLVPYMSKDYTVLCNLQLMHFHVSLRNVYVGALRILEACIPDPSCAADGGVNGMNMWHACTSSAPKLSDHTKHLSSVVQTCWQSAMVCI